MRAAVYRGESVVTVDEVHTPEIGPGEILIRVEACGVCHTDLKKIEYNLLAPPRIFGHETAGIVAAVGQTSRDTSLATGSSFSITSPAAIVFTASGNFTRNVPVYKKVGVTAGFEPAGGGFAQYVRVMDWIVERGVEKIPDGVPFEVAAFVEPVNTCLKAVEQCDPKPDDVVLVQGQGPIGLHLHDAAETARLHDCGDGYNSVAPRTFETVWGDFCSRSARPTMLPRNYRN